MNSFPNFFARDTFTERLIGLVSVICIGTDLPFYELFMSVLFRLCPFIRTSLAIFSSAFILAGLG
jgi:hypothetical protein